MHVVLRPGAYARTIIVGDVHGCLNELKSLLIKCSYDQTKDRIIFVGDLVNKGPDSAGVVRYAREINAYCVRGNHDDALLSKIETSKWRDKPKYRYVPDLTEEDIEWIKELPYTIRLPELNALVVHAGLLPQVSLEDQIVDSMTKIRNVISNDGNMCFSEDTDEGVAWAQVWKGPEHVYFGHDARRGLQQHSHATGLDTGCCYGRKLSAIILPEKRLVQVDSNWDARAQPDA